jgi:hypothetical protein
MLRKRGTCFQHLRSGWRSLINDLKFELIRRIGHEFEHIETYKRWFLTTIRQLNKTHVLESSSTHNPIYRNMVKILGMFYFQLIFPSHDVKILCAGRHVRLIPHLAKLLNVRHRERRDVVVRNLK